ncbi:hypothetical protein CJF32_00010143 [Rutstroemia sp. NJR-2017a WRK4]|nr:hypothetical protein CJF30_00004492 [Rutstroemia sp. NJR-2017a BBW]PQE30238.1 hypothetical protein CJF32_00010143 [Rutstroemia sp. NJR-2017a WRK4]
MDLRLLRRPVGDLFSTKSQCLLSLNTPTRRHESSYRRTKQRLNIAPHPQFVPSKDATQDHIIFNPPSSAPSVIHTPLKFIPKDDKRRKLLAVTAERLGAMSNRLPPPAFQKEMKYKRHHLTEEDVAEIRRLRTTDPEKWTRHKLAAKFNCSSIFIGMIVQSTPEKRELEKAKLEAIKARWGPIRAAAREDRQRRKELAKRDA